MSRSTARCTSSTPDTRICDLFRRGISRVPVEPYGSAGGGVAKANLREMGIPRQNPGDASERGGVPDRIDGEPPQHSKADWT
jgi:hypothetical protein